MLISVFPKNNVLNDISLGYRGGILIVYLTRAEWEEDWVVQDIFCNYYRTVIVGNNSEFDDINFWQTICDLHPSIPIFIVFNHTVGFNKMMQIVKQVKPHGLFQMSDEHFSELHYLHLSYFTKVMFRQHRIPPELQKQYEYSNVFCIPLAYMNGMLDQKSMCEILAGSTVPSYNRRYTWSFVGAIKSNRQDMINAFINADLGESFVHSSGGMKPCDMYNNIYKNSVFVLSGRGNARLDCFRHYECVIAGAIPVVVGTNSEYNPALCHNGIAPFVHAETIIDAVEQCKILLQNPEQLQMRQNQCRLWLLGAIKNIHKNIDAIL